MRHRWPPVAVFAILTSVPESTLAQIAPVPTRPVHTYSIVARDKQTGEIGVAVQSHWFSVGPIVPWAEAGVGAVATQSFADASYGPLGLHLMSIGRPAPDALRGLLEADEGRDVRQVAIIDAQGRVAAHTGKKCIATCGHTVDAAEQFSVQANLMEKDTVWPAMAEAFRKTREVQDADGTRRPAELVDRILAALDAAESQGGDIRGRQSAAIIIVKGVSSGRPWEDRLFDLRVEDHPAPLVELRRLVTIQRAYNRMNAGDLAVEKGDFEAANREYTAAGRLAPEIVEIRFWQAVTLAKNKRLDDALPIFREVFAKEKRWIPLIPRLVPAGLLPDDADMLKKIQAVGGP